MSEIFNMLKFDDLLLFLTKVDQDFNPSLSTMQSLENYASKLISKAYCEVVWHENIVVGLIAFYINESQEFSYLTLLAVEKSYRGKGISKALLNKMMDTLCSYPAIKKIKLEVHNDNNNAISLYQMYNFEISNEKNSNPNKMFLEKKLN